MKKSFSKIISVIMALMLAVSTMVCISFTASAKVDGCNCPCCELASGTGTGTSSADNGIRDIYLVLDISGSMSGTPIAKLKEAAKTFCEMMLNPVAGDNRIAIVTYATTVASYSFSNDIDELNAVIDAIVAKGSTNMYDALMKVKEIDSKYSRDDATKHVVVMADGLPNESATLTVGKYTSQDSSMYYKHGNAVYSVASGMWYDYEIYSIGFFHNIGGNQLKFGKVLMNDIQNALYLEVFDPDELVSAFTGVADSMVGCICEPGCTCGDDYGCCECCTAGPCTNVDENGMCNCDNECLCGENCTCGPNCKCDTPACNNSNPDENGNCNCSVNCTCGPDCDCGENCKCCVNNLNGNDSSDDKDQNSIPQTGDSATGIAVSAIMMLAGIAFVASKKRED